MPPFRRLVLALHAATILLVAGGLLLLVVPARVRGDDIPPTTIASAGALRDTMPASVVVDENATERVIATNIFSPRRSPPARRYMLGDVGDDATDDALESAVTSAPGDALMDSSAVSTASDPVPHLYGTVLAPGGAAALLRLDARLREPRLYRLGDRAGGYRVVSIDERTVTLAGPNGRQVLRLARPDQ